MIKFINKDWKKFKTKYFVSLKASHFQKVLFIVIDDITLDEPLYCADLAPNYI